MNPPTLLGALPPARHQETEVLGQQGLQLVELLVALAQAGTPQSMGACAAQWTADQLDSEVVALVAGDRILNAVGLRADDRTATRLLRQATAPTATSSTGPGTDVEPPAGATGTVDLPGLPGAHVLHAEVAHPHTPASLFVVRAGEPFEATERLLVLGVGRLLGQAVQAAQALGRERELRERSERLAAEREDLLRTLQQRELVLSTLLTLQQAISQRRPLEELLDLLCAGAHRVLGGHAVAVVLQHQLHPEQLEVRARAGTTPDTSGDAAAQYPWCPQTPAHAAEAMHAGGAVAGQHDGCCWRAAPVRAQDRTVGALVVVDDAPVDADAEQLLTTFTDNAGVALNDAYTARSLRESFYDQLTRLPNRALFLDRLAEAVRASGPDGDGGADDAPGRSAALLFLDLDGFKAVNDRYGHGAGDAVLQVCAERIRETLRPEDTAARLGGDEFAVVLHDVDVLTATQVAERLLHRLQQPVEHEGHWLHVGCSIGIAAPGREGTTADTLLRDADTAMYAAKSAPRPAPGPTVALFEHSMRQVRAERLELEADLACAVGAGQLELHYQPTVRLADERITGVEALVRWKHPRRGLLYPDAFIAVAEASGAITALGSWVLRQACSQAASWRGGDHPDLTVAVNLSVTQLRPALVAEVLGVLQDTGLPAPALVLEVTETVLVRESQQAREVLSRLREHGVRIAVDDFGTGYSSLSYLRQLPVDVLKVDRSFVRAMSRGEDTAVVRTIVGLAEALNLETVAEGVENAAEAGVLRALGCEQAQGYHWSRPVPAEQLSERLGASSSTGEHARATSTWEQGTLPERRAPGWSS